VGDAIVLCSQQIKFCDKNWPKLHFLLKTACLSTVMSRNRGDGARCRIMPKVSFNDIYSNLCPFCTCLSCGSLPKTQSGQGFNAGINREKHTRFLGIRVLGQISRQSPRMVRAASIGPRAAVAKTDQRAGLEEPTSPCQRGPGGIVAAQNAASQGRHQLPLGEIWAGG
jgi:hypothetical protein